MKYMWESRDIRVGRRVIAWNDTEEYIIGYMADVEGHQRYALISLIDGQVVHQHLDANEMSALFNKSFLKPVSIEKEQKHVR